jgi:redox-sensitive bicupin YhaK (pirin superfamily)
VFKPKKDIRLHSLVDSRILFLGGEPLGHRHMWWNLVSSRKERIAQAAADWKAGRFPPVPGETEFIPLPDNAPQVVDYP